MIVRLDLLAALAVLRELFFFRKKQRTRTSPLGRARVLCFSLSATRTHLMHTLSLFLPLHHVPLPERPAKLVLPALHLDVPMPRLHDHVPAARSHGERQ